MKNKTLYFLSVCLLVGIMVQISACEDYQPDPLFPGLPRYSEEGKMTSGAIFNNRAYVHTSWSFEGSFYPGYLIGEYFPGQERLTISTAIYATSDDSFDDDFLEIQLHITGLSFGSAEDMLSLKGLEIDFSNNSPHWATLDYGDDRYYTTAGKLKIHHASLTNYGGVILSGTFGFEAMNDFDQTLRVTHGRFDLAGSYNF
jgi:hypothetical protein